MDDKPCSAFAQSSPHMVGCAQLPVLAALGGTNTTWFLPWKGRNTVRVCGDLARRYLPRQSFSEAASRTVVEKGATHSTKSS